MLLTKKNKPRKNKSKGKKQRTFTSSEFSLPQDRQRSLGELFRNDVLRRRPPPAPIKKNKSQKQLQTTKKRTKSKSKLRLDRCETYEVVPFKNSLNSQIVFSNEDTRRQGSLAESSGQVAIKVNQQFLADSNRQLRISIKKEYQRKVEAAIKIQKVFRGYLTRKILLKYVNQQQRVLSQRLAHHRSESVSQHSSYFMDREGDQRRTQTQTHGVFQYQINNEEDSSSQEDIEQVVYRHHEPIYSHDQIGEYLDSSEEEDFNQDAFDHPIIFETNEEYIDSRKSSQQPPSRGKLSRGAHPSPLPIVEQPETPTNPPERREELTKTEKKPERIKHSEGDSGLKDNTLKLSDEGKPLTSFLEQMAYEATLKQKESSMMRKSGKRGPQLNATSLDRLKEAEATRWGQMVSLVQSQISRQVINNAQLCDFMQKIMQFSMKNMQNLQIPVKQQQDENKQEEESQRKMSGQSEKSLPRMDSRQKIKQYRAERQYLAHHQLQIAELPLQAPPHLTPSSHKQQPKEEGGRGEKERMGEGEKREGIDRSEQLKKLLASSSQEDELEEMLLLRDDLMKKRQTEEMRQLNTDLQNKLINQEQFLVRLESITTKYLEQRNSIQKAREDIARGHKAALRLTKEAVNDAKKLGYKLPVSRSVEGLRHKSPLFTHVLIDELAQPRKNPQAIQPPVKSLLSLQREPDEKFDLHAGSEDQSSDLEFTEQELRRFRRAQPYDIEIAEQIADLGRNVMISEELLRQQQAEEYDGMNNELMKTQQVSRQIYEIEEATPLKEDPMTEAIVDKMVQWLAIEAAGQLILKPVFSERLVDRSHFFKPKAVTDQERLLFLQLLRANFPAPQVLNQKLNQKICPLPTELLRCMRIDFSEEEQDEDSYEQVGKYDFIIDQQICNMAIKLFKDEVQAKNPTVIARTGEVEDLEAEYLLGQRLLRFLRQRETYISNRRNHTRELRWQVLNIELHCIFDAWNEELIFLRSQRAGYSGIGLNQLTLSVKDHNNRVSLESTMEVIETGRERLIKSLSLSSPGLIFPLQTEQQESDMLQTDSRWIFYADQALTYGLELVYLAEEQLFGQMARQMGLLLAKRG